MADMMRKKLPVSPSMYESSYRKHYRWYEEYKPRNKEEMQKLQIADAQLKAKEFAVPQEKKVMPYNDSVDWQRREGVPALSIKASSHAGDAAGRKPEGSTYGPKALQQRKHITSVLPAVGNYPTKYYTDTKLAATRAEKSGRPQALAELKNKLSYRRCLPAVTQTSGTAGSLLNRQKLVPNWATYHQFVQKSCQATKDDAQRNRDRNLKSSVLVEEHFDLNWRSVYNTDFQRCRGPYAEHRKPNKNLSYVFPEDDLLNQNDWVSQYEDSYSIFSQKRNQSSQIPSGGLYSGLSLGKGF